MLDYPIVHEMTNIMGSPDMEKTHNIYTVHTGHYKLCYQIICKYVKYQSRNIQVNRGSNTQYRIYGRDYDTRHITIHSLLTGEIGKQNQQQ